MRMAKLFCSILLVTTVFLTSCARETASDAESSSNDFQVEYEKYTLENGLDVILHVDRSDPVVAVASIFHVGSSREVTGRTGFAHFFEHMSFNDSENVPRGANRKYIPELGGTRNGGTSFDYTQYYEVVPSDAMEKIFWIDSDRMGYMINTVTEEALEREKQVVKNEKRQNYDNKPYGHTLPVILKNLFPEGHPYSWPVIGSLEDLQNATLDDVKEFYDRWYGANNATLAISGDFDPDEVKPMIEQWFGEIRRGPEVEPMEPQPVVLEESRNLWYPDNFARLPSLNRFYPTVEQYHPDSYALEILSELLAGTKSTPLYQVVVEEQALAASVSASTMHLELAGTFSIGTRTYAGKNLDDAAAAIDEGLARFAKEGVSESDLARIKVDLESSMYTSNSSVVGKALNLAMYNEFAGDPGFATENLRRLQAVTAEDVMRVFNKYVYGKHFVQTSFVPKSAPELAVSGSTLADVVEEEIVQGAEDEVSQGALAEFEKTPSKFDRSEPPLGELPVFRSPEIWNRTLANGIEVLGIEDREIPIVRFDLVLPGGSWLDSADRTGAAMLFAELAKQGTARRTPAELEQALGALGARISTTTSAEDLVISVRTLARNLDETMALVEEVLLEPRWDEAEFERLRNAFEAQIISRSGSAGSIASSVWRGIVFGTSHPYGRPGMGTAESMASMTLDDIKAWHARSFSPVGARLQVVGAVDADTIVAAFAGIAERWTGKAIELPRYDLPPPPRGQVVYFVDMPGAKQSVINVGKRAVPVTDPDWKRLDFATQRIGGGMSGRLMQLLRIEKGYTYGASASVGSQTYGASMWRASTSVRANVTLESIQLIRDQIADYAATFTDEDASVTRNQVVKSNARAFETGGAKLWLLERIAKYDLPQDIVELEMDTLQSMSTEDFREVITDQIDESEMVWVIVGDGKTQLDRVREFGYPVIELDKHGQPVKAD